MVGGLVRRKARMTPVFGYLIALSVLFGLVGCTGEQDQAVPDLAIAYVKRPIPIVPASNPQEMVDPDVRDPAAFNSGGDVYVRSSASPSASEQNITSCLTRADTVANPNDVDGDVKDLDTSYDGTKLIFSLIRPHNPADNDDINTRETWDIYEYDIAVGGCPTRVIPLPQNYPITDIEARKGDDLAPVYLPDGRIVFTSSRQDLVGAIQLDEGNSGIFPPQDENQNEDSLVLHVMSASGSNIQQISFNQSHDLDPSVLASGEIVFSRWDNMGNRNAINLFKVRPDGTELKALYGVHAHNVGTGGSTVQFLSPRELDDGRILGMIKPFNGSAGGGAPVLINVSQYADNNQPIWPYQGAGLTGNGQVNAVDTGVTTDDSISPAGRFRSVYPLRDGSNRALVSWTQCRLQPVDDMGLPLLEPPTPCPSTIPAGAVEAFPVYGIYVYDLGSNTQLPVVIPVEGFIYDEPVVVAAHPDPAILFDKAPGFGLDPTLSTEKVGLLHIRSVYDFDGGFNDLGAGVVNLTTMANPTLTDAVTRPARFLRIVKGSYIPSTDFYDFVDRNAAFGLTRRHGMREILGYVPVEPDGSVLARVPANVPLSISVVDQDGRRLGGRHQNWLQLRPGEVLECNGCHDHNPTAPSEPLPHGYSDDPMALNIGALIADVHPGTDPNPASAAKIGETMALTRVRLACGENNTGALGLNVSTAACSALSPQVDMRFTDVWTNPAGTPTPDLNVLYADLPPLTSPATLPATDACMDILPVNGWDINCRTIINYEEHIHYLWAQPRAAGVRTCTNCHTGAGVVPAAQLDLTDGPSDQDPDHFKAYRELLFTDNEVDVNGLDVTVDQIVQDTDADGNLLFETDPMTGELLLDGFGNPIPVLITIQVPVEAQGPTISVAGSRAGTFMGKFLLGGTHAGDLTAEEIRLLSEWIDVGAQYFNNPFDAPVN